MKRCDYCNDIVDDNEIVYITNRLKNVCWCCAEYGRAPSCEEDDE